MRPLGLLFVGVIFALNGFVGSRGACAAGIVKAAPTSAAPKYYAYPVPTSTPNFAPDSSFQSITPRTGSAPRPSFLPTTAAAPSSTPGAEAAPTVSGLYQGGGPGSKGGSSTFQSDQAPIIDPASVPKEITFEPRTRPSPARDRPAR